MNLIKKLASKLSVKTDDFNEKLIGDVFVFWAEILLINTEFSIMFTSGFSQVNRASMSDISVIELLVKYTSKVVFSSDSKMVFKFSSIMLILRGLILKKSFAY